MTHRSKNSSSSEKGDAQYKNAEKNLETQVAESNGHISVEKSWYGGTPTEDVNEWTV